MASFMKTDATLKEVERVMSQFPAKMEALNSWINEKCSASAEEFRKKSAGADKVKYNKTIRSLMNELRTMFVTYTEAIFVIQRFIISNVPKIEDGNNFGVSVQAHVLKISGEAREKIGKYLDAFPDYYSSRATAVEKISAGVVETSSTTSSKSTSTGGKAEESGEKTSKGESVDTKTTTNKALAQDLVEHVIALDTRQYHNLKFAAMDVLNSLAVIEAGVVKNMSKLKTPKTSSHYGY